MTEAGQIETTPIDDDVGRLHALGYAQELARRLSGFSNFAISLSIICILAGGVTSFHLGLCSAGGASIGLGWPLVSLFALVVAATMGQLASTFPTAGGLYHWASILGGRGWGWATAWFNLAGLVTVLAAINVGTYRFALGALGPPPGSLSSWSDYLLQAAGLIADHGVPGGDQSPGHRHHGPADRLQRLLDPPGRLAAHRLPAGVRSLVRAVAAGSSSSNFSGTPGGGTWPRTEQLWLALRPGRPPAGLHDHRLRRLGARLGGDARRRAERAPGHRPLGPGFGHRRLGLPLGRGPGRTQRRRGRRARRRGVPLDHRPGASPAAGHGADRGNRRGPVPLRAGHGDLGLADGLRLRPRRRRAVLVGRALGLPAAAVAGGRGLDAWPRRPSCSRSTPRSTRRSPPFARSSFTSPTCCRRSWARGRTAGPGPTMGPWHLGRWFRPLAWLSVAGCLALIVIGMQPPNERSVWVVGGMAVVLALVWIGGERYRFPGPPHLLEIGMGVSRPHAGESADGLRGGHMANRESSRHERGTATASGCWNASGSEPRRGSSRDVSADRIGPQPFLNYAPITPRRATP